MVQVYYFSKSVPAKQFEVFFSRFKQGDMVILMIILAAHTLPAFNIEIKQD